MTLEFIKICPKCKVASGDYHLMMVECDNCINGYSKETVEYLKVNGILVKKK